MMSKVVFLRLLLAWVLVVVGVESRSLLGQTPAKPITTDDFNPRVVVRPFPPIVEFPVVSAEEADKKLNPLELVLGVTIDGRARAYPINMLSGPRREIINDLLGGRAIAATW